MAGVDPAEGADDVRAGCISARYDVEDPTVPANEAAASAKARGETAAAEEAGEEALDVWIISVCPGNEEAEGWLEKKESTLLVPIGGNFMAVESIGQERRAASEAGR
jgi:hypothetical protein